MPIEASAKDISEFLASNMEAEVLSSDEPRVSRKIKVKAPPQQTKPEPEARQPEPPESKPKPKRNTPPSSKPLLTDLAQAWIEWQCRMIAGIIRGALYLPEDVDHLGGAIAIWPGEGEGESQLADVARQAFTENRGVARSLKRYGPENQRICDLVATPLLVDNEPVAVVAVMLSTRSKPQQHAVLQLLQWGGLWMEALVHRQTEEQREAGAFSLTLISSILAHTSFQAAAIEVVNQLAEQIGCERVSLGFRQGLPIRLKSLSHVASFDPRSQLVRRIEATMEEAVDQSTIMTYPCITGSELAVNRAHIELAEQHGNGAVCTIPLPGRSGSVGAITLERESSSPFDKDTVALCQSLAGLIGPSLELKQREERSVWSKGLEVMLELAATVFGSAHLKFKMVSLSVIALLTALTFIEGSYEVTAPASIEGAVRQVLVAPQDGYVKQAEVRAGDLVKKGQLIAELDDRNLRLEYQKWQGERNKIEKEYQDALAKHDRTALSILRAQIEQVDAELKLLQETIARTQLRAPFDGVVVNGDLSQALGAPVEIGQVLYEVAPLDSYRVVLEMDEHDVAGLDAGKPGHLIIAALPQMPFAIAVDQVVPVAVSNEASNYFRVEASLAEPSSMLRPGMRGVAKIEIGKENLLWIWTHTVSDRIRLWLWSLGW